MDEPFEIFLAGTPGMEQLLADEAQEAGFSGVAVVPGGVTLRGNWPDAWRANLALRGASRVLVRMGAFRAFHLAQLDKRARKFPWANVLRPQVPVRVDVTARRSKIYHAGAARERIARAIAEELGAPVSDEAMVRLLVRIDDNLVTVSIDTSGEPLHRRGLKQAVGKAPLRETLAALFLRAAGYAGSGAVLDPMCGSGTFVIEAAEIAAGLMPGRARRFAFEDLATFDAAQWNRMKTSTPAGLPEARFFGSDRDDGAIASARANAERAGIGGLCSFERRAVSDLARPEGPPGLVIVNPPYGARIGDRKLLYGLYGALGAVLKERFAGWRVGLVTSDEALSRATGLPWSPPGPLVPHGPLKVRLWQTAAL